MLLASFLHFVFLLSYLTISSSFSCVSYLANALYARGDEEASTGGTPNGVGFNKTLDWTDKDLRGDQRLIPGITFSAIPRGILVVLDQFSFHFV